MQVIALGLEQGGGMDTFPSSEMAVLNPVCCHLVQNGLNIELVKIIISTIFTLSRLMIFLSL